VFNTKRRFEKGPKESQKKRKREPNCANHFDQGGKRRKRGVEKRKGFLMGGGVYLLVRAP